MSVQANAQNYHSHSEGIILHTVVYTLNCLLPENNKFCIDI